MRPARQRGLGGRGQRDGDPDRDRGGERHRASRRGRRRGRRRPPYPRHAMTIAAEDEHRARSRRRRPDDPDARGPGGGTKPSDLTAGRAGRAEEADLADPLDDGHRERVEDEEGPDEQGDRRDQGGRRREVRGRGAQRGGEVGGQLQDVRLGVSPVSRPAATASVAHRRRGRCRPGGHRSVPKAAAPRRAVIHDRPAAGCRHRPVARRGCR